MMSGVTSNSRNILFGFLSLTIVGVGASNNFNYNDGSRNSPYLYREMESVDFDFIYSDDETGSSSDSYLNQPKKSLLDREQSESRMQSPYDYGSNSCDISLSEFDSNDHEEQRGSPSIIASSVLYDGECYFSSEAMMCNGGGGENMIDRFTYDDLFEDFDEEPSDDEDDDDDNDGHSSMLSTASLRRSKSMTRRERTRYHTNGASTTSKNDNQSTYVNKVVQLKNNLHLQHSEAFGLTQPKQQVHQDFSGQPRTESFAFIRERISTVARDASKAVKRS